MDVVCKRCEGCFHETTEHYDPAIPPSGHMFRLKEPFRTWGWPSFPEFDNGPGELVCPKCDHPYAMNGEPVCVRPGTGDAEDPPPMPMTPDEKLWEGLKMQQKKDSVRRGRRRQK